MTAPRTDPWVDRIDGSQPRVADLFATPYREHRDVSRVTDLFDMPHLDGCLVAFVYATNRGAPKRHIGHIAGFRCPRCRFDTLTVIEEQLERVVVTRVCWLGALTPAERRNVVQWRRRRRVKVSYLAVTRPDLPILWLSDVRVPGPCAPRLTPKGIAEVLEDLWSGPRVKHTAWSDDWRPERESAAKPQRSGVAAGFTQPHLADRAIRDAGYEPDIASGRDAPIVASDIKAAMADLNDGHDQDTDSWGRPREPE